MVMDPVRKVQIEAESGANSKAHVRALILDEAPTEVSVKYSDYNDVFPAENAAELSENTRINEHAI